MQIMKRSFGFTLVELMIAIAVLTILVTIAAPSFRTTIQNNRITTQLNDFVSSLQLARSEAVKRAQPVSLCISSDSASCTGANWGQGWIVFLDIDGDGALDVGDGDSVLNIGVQLSGNNTLTGSANVASSIRFNTRGFSPVTNGILIVCDERGNSNAKGILLSTTGRITRTPDSDADGIEEDGAGNPLSCP